MGCTVSVLPFIAYKLCLGVWAIAPDQCTVPIPSPGTVSMFQNTNRSASLFFQAAGITEGSNEHKELTRTIRALYRQYLHPFKYLEEQAPGRVDRLIAKARMTIPWLVRYEDSWPARVYLKRYVDTKRPHLMCTRYARKKQTDAARSAAAISSSCVDQAGLQPTMNLEDPKDVTVSDFLGSLAPSLEHHFDAFAQLGIKDQHTLRAFLSWPQYFQMQFLDEGDGVLQLTSLERKGLLLACGLLAQRALQESPSLPRLVKPTDLGA